MPARPTVPARLLDGLFTVSAVSLLLCGVLMALPPHVDGRRAVALLVLGGVLVALWRLRRRAQHPVPATVAFAAIAFGVTFVGDNLLAMLSSFCAIVLLVLDAGPRAGVLMVGALLAAQSALLVVFGRRAGDVLFEVAAAATLLCFVLGTAVLLRRSAVESAERARLLQERDAANARLEVANIRLRASVETEKELVLANERARSARELHDGLGHRLTAISMSLDFAQRVQATSPARAWEEVATAHRTAQEAIAEMRVWVRALNPMNVARLDGIHALDAVVDAFRGTGVDVRLTVSGEERRLQTDTLLFCHRFVQEGLTNAVRHACAQAVRIDITFTGTALVMTLEDDGAARGTAPSSIAPGFGLRSLTERAAMLGGRVDIGRSDDGTRLTARLPLPVTPCEPDPTADTGLVAAVGA